MHKRISLNGSDWLFKDFYGEGWRLGNAHTPESREPHGWRTGSVPGCPHHDLWQLGEIPDPYVDRNSLLCEWIPQRTWLYKKSFFIDREVEGQRVHLHFEGVDYRAEFFLNGESLGTRSGMFTPAVFEVTERLRYGSENLVAVVIEAAPPEQPQVGRTGHVRTTKTRMNYWWDFCPRLVHLGIWDDVYLEVGGPARIVDVFVRPGLSADFRRADVSVLTAVDSAGPLHVDLEVVLRHAGRIVARAGTPHYLETGPSCLQTSFSLTDPHLWWPNSHGEQALYQAEVRVIPCDGPPDHVSARRAVWFGIRRVELIPNESSDPHALPYTFVVNGRKIYVKGWNWVPVDALYSVPQPAKLERLLTLAKGAHVNLLRVWGGGLIETEAFYDRCDRLGLLVWQEFIQSSSGIENSPSTAPEYIQMVTEAAGQIIPRRRNHASLAAWCGGNELSDATGRPLDDSHPVLAALKRTVCQLDPDRLWLPTSPSGPVFMNSLETIGRDPSLLHDVHGPWEYQGLSGQYELYNRGASLFHSEFGVEGVTNRRTLDATLRRESQWPVDLSNPAWFHRGAWWVKRPMWDETFGGLPDIEALVRATQFMQADGLRYALEADRRRKYHNSGTLPWQFNEPYPMAACTSAVDYFGRPKPAYHGVARAYAPLLVSARFPRLAWGACEDFQAEAWVCNSWEHGYTDVVLRMRLVGMDGRAFAERIEPTSFGPNCAARLASLHESLASLTYDVFFLDLHLLDPGGQVLAHNRYVFSRTANLAPLLACPPAPLGVASRPEGSHSNESVLTITNRGAVAAMFVWLEDDRDLRGPGCAYFDDNYFCLLPGECRAVRVTWKDVPPGERRLEIAAWNSERYIWNDLEPGHETNRTADLNLPRA